MSQNRKVNQHERIVSEYVSQSISAYATFHPNLWRNGREPADMVIHLGRSIFLFNMHSSKRYFDDLCSHNIRQAIDRILDWRADRQIRGENNWKKFAISYGDVDNIVIISVVDGRHAGCMYHEINSFEFDGKVKICVSLTTRIVLEMARSGVGTRDLIEFCSFLRGKGRISELKARNILRTHTKGIASRVHAIPEPTRVGRGIINGKEVSWADQLRMAFIASRLQTGEVGVILADLSLAEIYEAVSFIIETLTRIEYEPQGLTFFKVMGGRVKFLLVVSNSMEAVAKNTETFVSQSKQADCKFMMFVNLMAWGPDIIFGIIDQNPDLATDALLGAMG